MSTNLRTARRDAGLSVEQVAHASSLHPGTVRRLEAEPRLTPAAVRIAATISAAEILMPANGSGTTVRDHVLLALLDRVDRLERSLAVPF